MKTADITPLRPDDNTTEATPVVAPRPERVAGDLDAVAELAQAHAQIVREIEKRIIGQRRVIDQLLVALFARGHTLFVGVPGLAKTLLISTLAETLNLTFQRIQFTPDLMPADITGTEVLEEDHTTGRRIFRFLKGPVFANLVLADEINRTPPKTQAALLQSMQEYRVTAGGTTHELPLPFLVFATQNPVEQEGTYPLPEAQLDRFMFQVDVDYPSEAEEEEIVRQQTSDHRPELVRVLSPQRITQLQDLVRRVPVADHAVKYAVALARSTRPPSPNAPPPRPPPPPPPSSAKPSPGAPARAPPSTSSSPPRRAPSSRAASPSPSKTSPPSRAPPSSTASSSTTAPRPKASAQATSSTASSPPSP